MRLSELDPQWLIDDGKRLGVTFLCPHCQKVRVGAKSAPLSMRDQMRIFARDFPNNGGQIVPMNESCSWTITGADCETMTITPSIDASKSGHWHGYVTNGEIK